MDHASIRHAAVDWGILAMVMMGLVLGGFALSDRLRGGVVSPLADRQIRDWRTYSDEGNRIGPEDAAVTIIEFGDYECPFCQQVAPILQAVLEANPRTVALVYRHFPISYHEHAYAGARVAECAAEQAWFAPVHQRLYELEHLSALDPQTLGLAAGIPDLPRFVACTADSTTVQRIERDIAAADRLGVRSTPTIIINGLQLASTPDSVRLFELVREAQRTP